MLLALSLLVLPARATWTVIGVDPATEEVGAAGATCGPFVWMVAGLSPGHGAVVAQYATNVGGRELAVERLGEGATPESVIEELSTTFDDDKIELRQYGVVGFAGPSAGFTGAEVEGALGEVGDESFRAQGNTLRTNAELEEAFAAMVEADGEPLAERLLRGLEAGRDLGGDARCPADAPARSAFLHVASPDDPKAVSIELDPVFGGDPVASLRARFDAGATGCSVSPPSPSVGWVGMLLLLHRRQAARRGAPRG